MLRLIAFDADDTLWHTEDMFQDTQVRLSDILKEYAENHRVEETLSATEQRNIRLFGYGIKGFTLSMVETAIELSDGQVEAKQIHEIIMMGKAMLDAPMRLFPQVEDVLPKLKDRFQLAIITKGDLLDQTNKIDKSGFADIFDYVEVVSEKDADTYKRLFGDWDLKASQVMMVGNSVPSDVLPVLEIGGRAVHIPYEVTAAHERHDEDPSTDRFARLNDLTELVEYLDTLDLQTMI